MKFLLGRAQSGISRLPKRRRVRTEEVDENFMSPQKQHVRQKRLRAEIGKHWLNDIATRRTPSIWDIYNFLLEVMRAFQLEKEASVTSLVYLRRFRLRSGVSLTPDNWQRLTICSLMLSSKVFDDESYENKDFAELCPLRLSGGEWAGSWSKIMIAGLSGMG
jgi:hypothetical protein